MNITIERFGFPSTLLKEYSHWVALLRSEQVTVGSLVIAAKSEATNLGGLTEEEWSEFAAVSQEAEALLREVFGAEKFNYLALMMKDPNVHFHLIPRYSAPVSVNGHEYPDQDWPTKTELEPVVMPPEDLAAIKSMLIEALG